MSLVFYDFEVVKEDWMVVIADPSNNTIHKIVNDVDELRKVYAMHINSIWVGWNNVRYDKHIFKSILLGKNPKACNDWIILGKENGFHFDTSGMWSIPMLNFDAKFSKLVSLKQVEGFMGHSIQESKISFDIDRKLTDDEIIEMMEYCSHDVAQTIEIFLKTKSEFDAHLALINEFKFPMTCMERTKASLSAMILDANKRSRNDEWDYTIVDTIDLGKYEFIREWFLNAENKNYEKSLECEIGGVPHIVAWGGLHGAIENYIGDGIFRNSDVASYYPALMIEYDFLSRNVKDPKKYREIRDTRLVLKKKKDPRQAPYKIVLNSTYGATKDKYNELYDPRQANNVCINGQLMLIDLIDKLEDAIPGFKLIQSNTDGILYKLPNTDDIAIADAVCNEWCKRVRMELETEDVSRVIQKDVNNYITVDPDGSVKSKGAWVKKLSDLDYDLAIVNKAVKDYFTKGASVEDTINSCDCLRDFQKIVKLSNKYDGALWGDESRHEKVFRVFASYDGHGMFKFKNGKNKEKFANTPEICRIVNDNILGERVPEWLDRSWYINMAIARIKDFKGEN